MKLLYAALLALAIGGAAAASEPGDGPLQGKVLETIDAGTYTYLRLQTADGEVWAATMHMEIPKGVNVVIHDPMLMTNFESKALNRTFERIVFGSAVDTETAATPVRPHTAAHGSAAAASAPVGKIARATGPEARTVAEVAAQRKQLAGKNVVVRGQVVKVSSGIMDRNWLHLRDGSGSAADATNDLLVTTSQTAKVGDVVAARGALRVDADFGSGYTYAFLIENATLQK